MEETPEVVVSTEDECKNKKVTQHDECPIIALTVVYAVFNLTL